MIYLDHAATTPVPRPVAEAMYRVLTEQYGNPSAQYPMGLAMKKRVEEWRAAVAALLDCPPEGLYFTSCGTEGDNWALRAALWQNRRVGRHIVTTCVEHSAVLETCKQLAQEGCEVTYIAPDREGRIRTEQVLEAVRPDTAVVSVMSVNNELGTRYPIGAIAGGLAGRNPRTLFHTDAVQALGTFSARAAGADFAAVSAHKIGGPKGIGALYVGPRVRSLRPLLCGGGQERGLRSGTEATAQMAGFAKAAELRLERREEDRQHLEALKAHALERFRNFPDLHIIGGAGDTAPHILSVSLEGWPSQNIVNDLGAREICISAGSACHQGRPSHVIGALGLPKKVAAGVVRLSFGPGTTVEEVDACIDALRDHHDQRMPML